MRALVVSALTGPDGVAPADVPEPLGAHPWAAGERLLIDVHAAGMSFPDLLQSRGEYQHAAAPPYVAGGEVAGTVLEAPAGSRFSSGDRVATLTIWGAVAEQALGLPQYTMKIPDSMSYEQGAAVVLNYATAWFALYRARFQAGETVLVHGAAGGVGTATIQVVRALGGTPMAVVSSDVKERIARLAGAEVVVRAAPGWVQQVKNLTDGLGVQVVIDPVGGDRFIDSLRALDIGGRLAVVGFAAGEIPTVKVNRLLLRDLSVIGVALAPFVARHPAVARQLTSALEQMAGEGRIAPLIGHSLPMDQVAEALRIIDRREALGKVVVRVKEPAASDG